MAPNPHPAPPTDHETGPALQAVLDLNGRTDVAITAELLPLVRTMSPTTPDPVVAVTGFQHDEFTIDGPGGSLTLSRFRPAEQRGPAPALFFVHGGGLIMGTRFALDGADELCRDLGLTLLSVEYRLAPEHPYPAALDDCVAAFEWVVQNAAELDVDNGRLVLGGASAGGGLAAATALRLRDAGDVQPLGLQLMCPMLDDRMRTVSAEQCATGVIWNRGSNEFGWASYLAGLDGDIPDTAAPGRATDLAGLPPTLIDVGDVDLFRDEDVAFASMLWAGGVNCELHVWPGAYHGSDSVAPNAAVTHAAKAARVDWYRRLFDKPSRSSS